MNRSVPSVSYARVQNNTRTYKHVRKKAVRNSKRRTLVDGKSSEYFPLISDEDSDEEVTLHDLNYLRNRQKLASKPHTLQNAKARHSYSDPFLYCDFINLDLQKGDTLQSISVKYGCSISDVKRANNIISNQEFYGLRQLKIPVKKNSVLTEIIPAANNGPLQGGENEESVDNVRTISIGIGPMLSNNTTNEAAAFLKKMDEDLLKIMLKTNSQKETLDEVTAALTDPHFHPLVKATCNTVHNVQWSWLFICCIIIAVIIPLIIVLYMMYMRPSNHPHTTESYSNSSTLENTTLKTSASNKS